MHGAQERIFVARPSIARSGLHVVNKLFTKLLLRVPMYKASVHRMEFHKDKAVRSSYTKMWDYAILQSPCA